MTFLNMMMSVGVPLDIMVKFKRLAELSTDHDVLVTALSKSTGGLMEVRAIYKIANVAT